MLLETGIRNNELCILKDISISDSVLTILGKGNKERQVGISSILQKQLITYNRIKKSYFEDKTIHHDALFLSRTGRKCTGFRRVRDNMEVDITKLGEDDMNDLFYKEIPYTTKQLDQRLIITYSPKYAAYQKKIREKQIECAESMIKSGNTKKSKNQNDPARFIKKTSVTKEGEVAEYQSNELDMDKIRWSICCLY